MNIYVSGAVTGVKDYRYIFIDKTFHLNKKNNQYGLYFINPVEMNSQFDALDINNNQLLSYDDFMKLCYAELELCDGIYLMKGWRDSMGANRELGFAKGQKKMIFLEEVCGEDVYEYYFKNQTKRIVVYHSK